MLKIFRNRSLFHKRLIFSNYQDHRNYSIDTTSTSKFCIDCVRKYDFENYLCCLLLPDAIRLSAFAVRAFNVEIAQIRDVVSDRNIGLMRIRFWRDILDHIYQGSPPNTPIAIQLAKAVHQHKLSKQWFTRILDAREQNLFDVGYMNIKDVEDYAEKSVSSVLYLILEALGVKDIHADHVASHVSKAQGIVTLIRATPHLAHRQIVHLPMEFMIKHNVSQEEVIRGCREQKMKDLIFELASIAKTHLDTARSLKPKLPKISYSAFLPAVSCQAFLTSIQRTDFDLFDPRLRHRNNWLPLILWFHKLRKTY